MWRYTLLFGLQIFSFISTLSGHRNVTTKLHHPVTLTCDWTCPGSLRWSYKFHKVVSQCDQSSCRSEEGFNISHDQYLKGKPYLTITAADYSNRGTYTCQCEDSEVCDVRLIIQTQEMQRVITPGEDIDVHLPLTDMVDVSFTPSDAEQPPNQQICNMENEKIDCSPDYKERASRLNTLQLKDGRGSDSGIYTLRDTVNEETLAIVHVHVRDEAVSGPHSRGRRSVHELCQEGGVPVWAVVLIVLLLLLGAAFGAAFVSVSVMYLRLRREHQRLRVESEENRPEQIPMNGKPDAH